MALWNTRKRLKQDELYYMASQTQLIWRKFSRHRLAIIGSIVLSIFYLMAIFCEFIAPYDPHQALVKYIESPPQRIHFVDEEGNFSIFPFVYELDQVMDMETLGITYTEDTSQASRIKLFVRGAEYNMWGLVKSDLHLFGTEDDVPLLLFGTDKLGRDLFSRTIYASRISLSISVLGVAISFVLGCIIGGISGYFGGIIDMVIQRVIEFLMILPKIPLWMALAAALPPEWPSTKVFLGITIILSLLGWPALARVVRGKLMSLKQEDFVLATRLVGGKDGYIILKHLIPSFMSYLIVNVTLSVPSMILGETSLSFLGLGVQPPSLSWGVLLKEAQSLRVLAQFPWLLIPAGFVILTVLAFNLVGDGLRDAADPYKL